MSKLMQQESFDKVWEMTDQLDHKYIKVKDPTGLLEYSFSE